MTDTWWAEHAWLGGPATHPGVLLEVKDGRFVSVTPGSIVPPPGAIRLSGLTLPGLVNAHSHAFHRALRGRTHERSGSFWSWRDMMYEVADRLDPERYRRLAAGVFAEMTLAGFTAVGEFHYLHHGSGGVAYNDPNEMGNAVIAAASDAGIRLTLLDCLYLRGGFDAELQGVQLRFTDKTASAWAERVAGIAASELVHVGAAVHSVRAVNPDDAAEAARFAESQGMVLHSHVAEQRREVAECSARCGVTPLGLLQSAGAIDDRFTAVHGTHFTADDIAALGSARASCCACPTTERDLGDGIGPFAAMRSESVRLCIGSDSHAIIDGLEEARAMELDARLAEERRGVLPATALVDAACAGGAASLGWDAGRLAPGVLADFVTVRLDSVRTAGSDPSLVASAVFGATAADVDTVVVGGRTVVRSGRHVLVGDPASQLESSIRDLLA